MDVAHLVKEKLGVGGVVLNREVVRVNALIVEEDLVEEVLMKDFILGGEELSFGGLLSQRVIEGDVVPEGTCLRRALFLVSEHEAYEHHLGLLIALLLLKHALEVSD